MPKKRNITQIWVDEEFRIKLKAQAASEGFKSMVDLTRNITDVQTNPPKKKNKRI